MAYYTSTLGRPSLVDPRSTPRLRPKPSTNRLRSTSSSRNSPPSPPPGPQFKASAIPRSATAGVEMDPSIYTRKERRPSALPKPAERNTTPLTRTRTAPAAKDAQVFSAPRRTATTVGSTDPPAVRNVRRVIGKQPPTMEKSYALGGGVRNASATSFGASTASSTGSSQQGGYRNGSQGSVFLGMAMPATSASSSHIRKRSDGGSSSVPRLMTQDLPPHTFCGPSYESSPSTRYTDSPFSHISSPTSSSSHSPGPAAMIRAASASPGRLVGRPRKGSVASVEISLDTVRESTTSASSDSTIKASERNRAVQTPEPHHPQPPHPGHRQPSGTSSAPTTPFLGKSPKLGSSSPRLGASKTPEPPRRRPSHGATGIPARPDIHKQQPTGLGVSLPSQPSSAPINLTRTRSRSTSSSLPQRTRRDAATPPPPALPSPGLQPQPNTLRKPQQIPQPSKSVRERSASPSKKSYRLPFLSRGRTKSEDKQDKVPRKGPVAGTGYEGYGHFGKASRGRSGSSSGLTSGGRSRSGSQTSVNGRSRSGSRPGSRASAELEMDDFIRERLNPVVMVGGEVVENRNLPADMVRTTSSPGPVEMMRTISNQSLEPGRSGSSLAVKREPSPTSVDKETVATRRANGGRAITPIPSPIITSGRLVPTPSPVSSLASSSRKQSLDSHDTVVPNTPATGQPKSRRWNLFGRSQKHAAAAAAIPEPPPSAPATFTRSVSRRHVPAHYALLDQEEQREAAELVERLHELRQQNVVSTDAPAPAPAPQYTHILRKKQSVHFHESPVPDSAPLLGLKSPSPMQLSRDDAERMRERVRKAAADERRMMQHAEQRRPSAPNVPELDTRPTLLVRTELPAEAYNQLWSAPPVQRPATRPEFQIPWDASGLIPTNSTPAPDEVVEYDPLDPKGKRPMPAAVDTPVTAVSVIGPNEWPIRNDSISTPPVPTVQIYEPIEQEEEHWPEYNDLAALYGAVVQNPAPVAAAKPVKRTNTVQSTTSSLGASFQYDFGGFYDGHSEEEKIDEEDIEEAPEFNNESPTLRPIRNLPKDIPAEIPILEFPKPKFGPQEMLPHTPPAQRVLTPATPFSMNSFIRHYEDNRVTSVLEPLSTASGTSTIEASPPRSHKSNRSNESNETSNSGGTVSSQLAVDEMKVRPWALLASRWLSFDRVLVSPAHDTIQLGGGGRILVVDGLGTDDWSFYCALTYPGAKVYNLTQTAPGPPGSVPASPSVPRPANHKQVYHPSLTCAFPFPKGFFSAISFRFLPSSTDRHWSLLLSECKRVLQPGGHLEVTVLDADLIHMGPRAKRAVDLVKAIMERENEGSSSRRTPRPASEKVLHILHKKGFQDVSKCFVGLPAVGKVDGSQSIDLTKASREPSPDDSESINEVVSKVGRWWYTRCYERVITAQGEASYRSMWNDKGLLRECAKKHTNFKMLVCHATKPRGNASG